MTITAAFEDFEDMMDFAKKLAGRNQETLPVVQTASPAAQKAERPTAEGIVGLTQPAPAVQTPLTPPTQQPAPTAPVQTAPVQTAPVQPAPAAPVPTTTPGYALDDLARAAMALMDSGKQADLIGLLKSFGVEALPALPPEQYGAFATALRGMGAQI